MALFLLAVSAVLSIGAVAPYIRDVTRGRTKPNLASWATWTLLFVVATVAEIGAHEYRTAFFTASITVETLLVAVLGARFGYARYTRFDAACQVGALSGFVAWWVFDNPTVAVVLVMAIDFLAALPTFEHAWQHPGEETWSTFALSGLGGLAALGALESYTLSSAAYPVYIVAINVVLVSVILGRRRVVGVTVVG